MVKFLILLLLAVHMCRAQGPSPGIFQFEAVQIRESEDSVVATVVIVNTGNTAQSATVSVSTADSTATGGLFSDFVPLSGELVRFAPGEARKEVSITIIDDDAVENEESFTVSLQLHGPSRPSAALGERTTLTVIIEDNDGVQPTTASAGNGGGNITVDAEAKIQVVCMADFIEVSLQMSDYPGLIVNDSVPHLEDKACVAKKNDSMVKFKFGLEACNTQMEDDGDKIYYKNTLYVKADEKSNDSAITREHTGVIPFQCGYDKKTVISKVSYNPSSTLFITRAAGFGNFTYHMDMYEDGSNNVTVTEFPKVVGLGQTIYFSIRVESGDSELVLFPENCKATASPSFDSTPDHLIIENACSRDNTLDYTYDKNSQHNFSLTAFRFREEYDYVYIHCKVTVCREADSGSRCERGCEASKRRRRSIEEDMSAEVYVGPLKPKLRTNEPAKEQNLESESSSNSMILIVAVLVGVLGTVALGLIIAVVILSRRRSASGKGHSLIVAEEM